MRAHSTTRRLARLALTDAVPALGWNTRCHTQRKPYLSGVTAFTDRLSRGEPAELGEREIFSKHPAVGLAKLIRDGDTKLTQAH